MITPDERAILDGCYRCACSGCVRRRELIAKVLGELDAATARVADLERYAAIADKGRYDNATAADLAEKRALQAEGQLRAEREAHARTQHWVEEFQGSTAAATVEGMRLRQRVATAMETPITVEAIRAGVFEALKPSRAEPERCIECGSLLAEDCGDCAVCAAREPADAVIGSTP